MKVRIVNRPYFDNAAVHQPDAVVDIAGPEQFSTACMVPADRAAEEELVNAGLWPLDDAGNPPKKARAGAAAGGVSLVDVAKTEAQRIVTEARDEASGIRSAARNDADGIIAKAKTDAGDIIAKAKTDAGDIVAKAQLDAEAITKKATETKKA